MPSKTTTNDSIMEVDNSLHVVPPTGAHTHTVIFLHSRESTAAEFSSEFLESQASDDCTLPEVFPNVKWIFPSPVTGKRSRVDTNESQWFDMREFKNPQDRKDLQISGLRESIAYVLNIIRNEVSQSQIPPERIVLGGFSQGCATAIHTLLFGGIRLGGFIGLSGWLPFQEDIESMARYSASNFTLLQNIRGIFKTPNNKSMLSGEPSLSNRSSKLNDSNSASAAPIPLSESFSNSDLAFKTPVFLSHSKDDKVVPYDNGDMLCWRLEEVLGFDVDWKTYKNGGHWINEPQGVDDIVAFLKGKVIKA